MEEKYEVFLVTGIVSQQYMIEYLLNYTNKLQPIEYPDHHQYTAEDLTSISKKFIDSDEAKKIIITTEKDAARLIDNPNVPDEIKPFIYVLPIKVVFLFDQEKKFNEQILGYVSKNKTNRGLFKK